MATSHSKKTTTPWAITHQYGTSHYNQCCSSIVLCSCWAGALDCLRRYLSPLPKPYLSLSWTQARCIDFLVRFCCILTASYQVANATPGMNSTTRCILYTVNTSSIFEIFTKNMGPLFESIPTSCTSLLPNSTRRCTPQPKRPTNGIGSRGYLAWMEPHSQPLTTINIVRGGRL